LVSIRLVIPLLLVHHLPIILSLFSPPTSVPGL
jgi:hypothetical protein